MALFGRVTTRSKQWEFNSPRMKGARKPIPSAPGPQLRKPGSRLISGAAKTAFGLVLIGLLTLPSQAGEADVIDARITKTGDRVYTITVTVEHGDDGWDHYADGWEVIGPDGRIIAKRVLAHPHVNEQPFTRSKSGIKIAADIKTVTIRAHDLEHAYGGKSLELEVPE